VPDIRVADNPPEHRYEIFLDNKLAGFVTYSLVPPAITLIHTEIDPAFEGHGLGSRLAHDLLTDLEARGLDIKIRCPFLWRYVREHPEWLDKVSRAAP
jgi:predicted GNAT family acetyltransferase